MGNLYEIIVGLCNERGITQYRMCKDAGVARSTMTELKSGRTQSLSAETLQKIAGYFHVPVDFLLDLGEPNPADISPEHPVSESQLLFALYGEVPEEIDKEDIEEIKKYADMVRLRKIAEKKGE